MNLSVKRIFLVLVLLALPVLPAWSLDTPAKTLLIADSGFSENDPIIAAHTSYQLCIMDWYACPNGTNFQESGTAAMLSAAQLKTAGFSHGSKMARAAIAAYPDVKLILVRIIGQSSNGNRMPASEEIITRVLAWANKNAKLYNIGSIAISQGSNKIGANSRKCLSVPSTEREIASLKSKGIYTFFPAGNEGKSSAINWPACITDAVAVGALDKKGSIASYSNSAFGQIDIHEPGYSIDLTSEPQYSAENGTSYSTQYAAARWLSLVNQFPASRPSLIFWKYIFSGEVVTNSKGQTGWSSDIDAARIELTGH